MRPIWDMYWSAMDMTNSVTAKKAVAATRKLFEDHPNKMPPKEKVVEVALMYTKFRSLKEKVDAVLKLAEIGGWTDKIKFRDGRNLYDGTYFKE